MNIVLLDAATLGLTDFSMFSDLGNFVQYANTPPDGVSERIKGAQIVITNKVKISADNIRKADKLRLICISATGTDHVDCQAAAAAGIEVKNVKGYSTENVAQLAWGMILQLTNQTNYFDDYVKSGRYAQSEMFTNFARPYRKLAGLQLGIVGLGAIGERVAEIAEVFKMTIAFYSPSGKRTHPRYTKMSLKRLLETSDVLSIHTQLTPLTQNLIGKNELALMHPEAILINTARGGIVNELALKESIDNKQIAGAGIDVFTQEPIHPENPLLQIADKTRLVLTPHIGWISPDTRHNLMASVAKNIQTFLEKSGKKS